MLNDRVNIPLQEGTLTIHPLSENAVRIKFYKEPEPNVPEFVLNFVQAVPFKISDSFSKLEVKLKGIIVVVDKQTGNLSFEDSSENVFLREIPGTRQLISNSVMGEPCFIAEQSFESSPDEHIFGLGQFQDGHYNLKGVSRRLIQVNSQIAIPFIYSSKGYGLLWHQYGLTDFNPADNLITLEKKGKPPESDKLVEATTDTGTQKVLQNQSLYTGEFHVTKDGEYSIFLDLGTMANRYFLVIDGKTILDQSNIWLPPTIGTSVQLAAGKHYVQLICKSDNTPQLSWKLKDNFTTFRSPNAKLLDYIVMYGPSADRVIATYRKLTGDVPLLPLWAYGFWQCRERYTSASHLIETVKEFRRRKLPMDVIVQDWQYWGNRGWGVPEFDETHYPNPSGFIKELHDLNAHFCISIWSNPDQNSSLGKVFLAKNLFIPNTPWLDYFNPEAQREYWSTLKTNMFDHGVDAWWMDAVEPENDALKGTRTSIGVGDFYRLIYPLMVSKTVYEGQRATTSDKRVCILTRSAFLGQQRYGMINWSGDIGGTWDAFRRQIVAGLNYTLTGLPYWTTDIGGFFRPRQAQYIDEKYHELLIRWFQWGAFNPIFRVHGFQSETEPWKYGEVVEEIIKSTLNLRYHLIPYIYSEAWQVTKYGSTMMRPLVMDFREDTMALSCPYEFMFGKSILVVPVTEPGIEERSVYLPGSVDWYDFWTGEKYKGGRWIKKRISLSIIPLYVKAGSIIPFGPMIQYTGEKPFDPIRLFVYTGKDGTFTLYEDEGTNYNYEKGKYSTIEFTYNEEKNELCIGQRKGAFNGMLKKRTFEIVWINEEKLAGIGSELIPDAIVTYEGKPLTIKMRRK